MLSALKFVFSWVHVNGTTLIFFWHLYLTEQRLIIYLNIPPAVLFWLEQLDNERVWRVKKEMERAVEKCRQDSAEDGDGSPIVAEKCQAQVFDLFSKIMRPWKGLTNRSLRSKAESLVATWLDHSKQDDTDMTFLGEPVLVRLFVQYNTTIPSSAAVERIFSTGKDILKPKRASLGQKFWENSLKYLVRHSF